MTSVSVAVEHKLFTAAAIYVGELLNFILNQSLFNK